MTNDLVELFILCMLWRETWKCDTKFDFECMVTFYKGILNKTHLYILISSLVWQEICSVSNDDSFSFVEYFLISESQLWSDFPLRLKLICFSKLPCLCLVHFVPQLCPKNALSSFSPSLVRPPKKVHVCVWWCCVEYVHSEYLDSACLLIFFFSFLHILLVCIWVVFGLYCRKGTHFGRQYLLWNTCLVTVLHLQ